MSRQKQIRDRVYQLILDELRFKGEHMRFQYFDENGKEKYAEVRLKIKWNKK